MKTKKPIDTLGYLVEAGKACQKAGIRNPERLPDLIEWAKEVISSFELTGTSAEELVEILNSLDLQTPLMFGHVTEHDMP